MKHVSSNNIVLSGRLTADAQTNTEKSYARFSIAHNMGTAKDGTKKVVFVNFTMFAKNKNRETPIPFDLLKKGTPVEVWAYFTPTEKGYEFFVKSVVPAQEVKDETQEKQEEAE